MPGGRTSKYSPQVAHTICVHVSYGCPLEMAAAAEGVSAETVRRWRQRYPAFAAQVEQARASCVVRLLGCLNKAALGGSWKAAAWLLERTRPASYGPPPRRVALGVGMNAPDFSQMSDQDLETLIVKLGGPAALGLHTPAAAPLTSLPAPRDGGNGHHSGDDQDVLPQAEPVRSAAPVPHLSPSGRFSCDRRGHVVRPGGAQTEEQL